MFEKMVVTLRRPQGSSVRVLSSTLALAVLTVGFMVPGLVRTKVSSVVFGTHGVAVVGQISQLQTLVITVGTAGLVSATRVILARRSLSVEEMRRLKNWLLFWPALFSLLAAIAVTVLSAQISLLLLGSTTYGSLIALAGFGVPFAVVGQISLAIVQVSGSRRRLVVAAVSVAAVGGLAVLGLIWSGSLELMAATFLVAPACQLAVIMASCREARPSLRHPPKATKGQVAELVFLSWASLVLGGAASAADIVARTLLVSAAGLEEVARYQPVVLLVTQMLTVAVSALATSSLVELGSASTLDALSVKAAEICSRVVPLAMIVASGVLAASPWLISIFYTPALARAALPVFSVAILGEVPRVYSWVVGSCLLPFGLRNQWLLNGLGTVAIQLGVSAALIPSAGAFGLAWGLVCANYFSAAFTTWLLWRRGIRVSRKYVAFALAYPPFLLAAAHWDVGEFPLGLLVLISLVIIVAVVRIPARRIKGEHSESR